MPVLDAVGKDWFGKDRVEAPLEGDGAALEERAPGSFGLGVAIEKFKPEVEIGLDLEVIFTQSYEIG